MALDGFPLKLTQRPEFQRKVIPGDTGMGGCEGGVLEAGDYCGLTPTGVLEQKQHAMGSRWEIFLKVEGSRERK